MQEVDQNWPEEAREALREERSKTQLAGCGGCVYAEWAGSGAEEGKPPNMVKKFKVHVATCRAGVQLAPRGTGGLLNAVEYCTARNRPLDGAGSRVRGAEQSSLVAPTLRPSPLGLPK